MYFDVDFGDEFSGIGTVGYQITDAVGAVVVARTTTGVFEIGHGKYGVSTGNLAVGFVGTIYWDTAASSSINALERIDLSQAGILDVPDTIAPGVSLRGATKVMLGVAAAKLSGVGDPQIHIRNVEDTKDVVLADVDGAGNRTHTVIDPT